MNDRLRLTDRYGGGFRLRRERVDVFYEDSVIQGDGEKCQRVMGTTIILTNSDAYFVKNTLEDIDTQMDAID